MKISVLVGSRNPVKMEATREAFSAYFDTVEVTGIGVSSNVSDQPIDDETFAGARNRAFELKNLVDKERNGDADFFVGIWKGSIHRTLF